MKEYESLESRRVTFQVTFALIYVAVPIEDLAKKIRDKAGSASEIVYDREGSSFASATASDIPSGRNVRCRSRK